MLAIADPRRARSMCSCAPHAAEQKAPPSQRSSHYLRTRRRSNPQHTLDDGEQACDIYDAYLAYHPQSNVRFEELMLLKRSLAKGDLVELGLCRVCKGLIINNRYRSLLGAPVRTANAFVNMNKTRKFSEKATALG